MSLDLDAIAAELRGHLADWREDGASRGELNAYAAGFMAGRGVPHVDTDKIRQAIREAIR